MNIYTQRKSSVPIRVWPVLWVAVLFFTNAWSIEGKNSLLNPSQIANHASLAGLTITGTVNNADCGTTGLDGAITGLVVTGGSGDYSYAWSTGSTANSISGLQPAYYTVTVTDNQNLGLSGSKTFAVQGIDPTFSIYVDADGDGFGNTALEIQACQLTLLGSGYAAMEGDCNDNNAAINDNAIEVCNGVDDDCDGDIDANDSQITLTVWYEDADNDTYGNPASSQSACSVPLGYVATTGDCDDGDPTVNPGASETCNNVDDNCVNGVDEGLLITWYADSDGDGFGDPLVTADACYAPPGYVANDNDCNDNNAAVKPGATEVCNSIDDNCNGNVDDIPLSTYYLDSDGDGYGEAGATFQLGCNTSGFSANNLDCNDGSSLIYPGAAETCNSIDDDCDGQTDEGLQLTYYRDLDGDGFGNATVTTQACYAPVGYVADDNDCDDSNASINPNVTETCNGIDDNCDSNVDNITLTTYYADVDNDTYGDINFPIQVGCTIPAGYVSNSSDCNDAVASANPGATEVCNSIDDDCDTQVDEGVTLSWFADVDGDGFGNPGSSVQDCYAPVGYVSDNNDCNDANASVNPNAIEVCNSIDDDCDGTVDNVPLTNNYADSDGDGYGDAAYPFPYTCTPPAGTVSNDQDCDDGNAAVNPGATEVCNLMDDDCDGATDEGVSQTWYLDADADFFGDINSTASGCYAPPGYVADNNDCNDANASVNPNATEVCDGIDNDCDGNIDNVAFTTYYTDVDGDGFGDSNFSISVTCTVPSGYVLIGGDCDDAVSAVNPNATEVCNSIDDDCDGQTDEGLTQSWFRDLDGDGYGDPNNSVNDCYAPLGYLSDNNDCDDNNATINPDGVEVCDGVDNDCDGNIDNVAMTTYYVDSDGDGFGDPNHPISVTCTPPVGYILNNTDCDDGNASVYPGATETCNTVDDDCDNSVDEGVQSTWYRDADGDNFGDPAVTTLSCSMPVGYVGDNTDCNDADANINPSITEICNSIDDDCDGLFDTNDPSYADNIPPVAVCRNLTVYLNATGTASITAAQVNNGSADNCQIASLDLNQYTFGCANVGANTITLTVTDLKGNTNTCASNVTVIDTISPVAVCQNITVQLNAAGTVSITSAQINNGSSDACGIASLSVSPNTFTCANVGPNTVTLTVVDNNGNTSTCTSTVTVQDNVAPAIVCKNITVQLNAAGVATIDTASVTQSASDACGIASRSIDISSFTCANVGPNTVTLTVIDNNGNSSTCTSTVTVQDNVAPAIACKNITVQLNSFGVATIDTASVTQSASDACGIASRSIDISSFTCANVGPNTVTLTVIDNNGNTSTCTSTVTVQDNVAPAIACKNITVQLNASGVATIDTASITQSASDACGIASRSIDISSFTCANVGPNTVTLTVVDNNGNTSTCTATVTVQDNVAPVANCKNITVQLNASGNASITAAQINNNSTDACGIASMTVSPNSFTVANVGANTVTLTVVDNNGNTSTCTATVTIEDKVLPVALCQDITVQLDATGNVSITAAQVDNGSYDASGILFLSVSPNSFTCANVGPNTVTLTATDNNGNTSTCTSTVTVQDNVAPAIACKNITVQLNASGVATIDTASVTQSASDACGIASRSIDISSFTCANVGANTVTLTVIDNNGNTSTCTSTVTVQDNVAPAIACKNITVQLNAAGVATIDTASVTQSASDACGIASRSIDVSSFTCANVGANTVTLTIVDNNGNTSTCTSTVTVQDNIAPAIVCKDITVQLNAAGVATIDTASVTQSASDACGIASRSIDISSFTCANVGANTVTLTIVDNNGNTSTCTSTVTVQDNVAPVANCQNITVQLSAAGTASITAAQVNNGSTDACGIASLSVSPNSFTCSNVGGNTVTLTVVDNNGNTSTCTSTVTVVDTVKPVPTVANLPQLSDQCAITSITAPTANDACGGVLTGTTSDPLSYTAQGSFTITWTYTDANGNTTTQTQSVVIDDVTAPSFTNCPSNIFQCGATATWTAPTPNDNCTGYSVVSSHNPGDSFPLGTTTVTYTITDVGGNTASCSFNVMILPTPVWYADADGDTYGNAGVSQASCTQPVGYVLDNSDCNDNAAGVNPAAQEICNGIDDDCDGDVDDNDASVTGLTKWFVDADADGFGDVAVFQFSCLQPTGYVADSTDCDDGAATTYPGATELCNNVDDDCDGSVDDGLTFTTYYNDFDGDSYGAGAGVSLCYNPGAGYATADGDCNDNDAAINPGVQEVCDNGVDNDCDGLADDADPSTAGKLTWYADTDGDGYGNPSNSTLACNQPAGHTLDNNDCNDNAAAVNPDAQEICNGIDDDCDGDVDEQDASLIGLVKWFADADADGFGDVAVFQFSCSQPSGFVADSTDCDDAASTTYPGATELCNNVDDDCDGSVDDGLTFTTYYNDFDGDNYGTGAGVSLCYNPGAGYATQDGDCNDNDATINPSIQEVCDNGLDNDCDGLADDADPSTTGKLTWYADSDGDGFGDASSSTLACNQPAGYTLDNSDCNDNASGVNPDAQEICNGIDDDCDGDVDDQDASLSGIVKWFADADADGFGDVTVFQFSCSQPTGYVADSTDCDDAASTTYPGAIELCNNVDDDCDGSADDGLTFTTYYNDFDGDNYGTGAGLSLCYDPGTGYATADGDCNDNDAAINPSAQEICDNGVDNDCDGLADDADGSITGQLTWYADVDGDGFGNPAAPLNSCDQPSGYSIDNSDCDDTNALVNPAAQEICNGGIDDDCDGDIDDQDASLIGLPTWYSDADGDGFGDINYPQVSCTQPSGYVSAGTDCDDADATSYPGATELCDAIDNDCDGVADNGLPFTNYYVDFDNDSYGTGTAISLCYDPGVGYAIQDGDCDESNAAINPAALEECDNGVDNDCNGLIDDADPSVLGQLTWYADADGDGFGNAAVSVITCNQPAGYSIDNSDCDDSNALVNPAAQEICNGGIDDDCDGDIDDQDASLIGLPTWYADADGDGFGDINYPQVSCTQPSGYVSTSTDCDDSDANTYPGATELCDALDNDCDGVADNGLTFTNYYVDFDADTYGAGSAINLCYDPGAGYATQDGDCDDGNAAINPAATELCDGGVDNDCDGLIDDADPSVADQITWYADADGDGFGNGSVSSLACIQPIGYTLDNSDCDDNSATVNPDAQEICNGGIDDDCDGDIDDQDASLIGLPTWYADADADGFGDINFSQVSCTQPSGYVSTSTDCDDSDANTFPGATELCDAIDNDCDGVVDNGVTFTNYYVDFDGDTYGTGTALNLCYDPGTGYTTNNLDCDDGNAAINPAATEICDLGVDNDCDGLSDDADPSVTGQLTWFADADGDTYGNAAVSSIACDQPAGYVLDNSDCADNNAAVNVAAQETCNGIDDDCDGDVDDDDASVIGQSVWYADTDGDNYGDVAVTQSACFQPTGYVSNSTDCDDAAATTYPVAPELCNNVDDDCDGNVDNGLTFITYYVDFDNDNFGTGAGVSLCNDPGAGYATQDGDCDDSNAAINPDATEICDLGVDNDCDGLSDDADPSISGQVTWYADADGDTYGDAGADSVACYQPSGYVFDNSDCNDNNAAVNTAAQEICNGIDDDCDGDVDDDDASVSGQSVWYADADSDGFGDLNVTQTVCFQPAGYVSNNTDCDDATATTYPGATEVCNGVDDDCDGTADDSLTFITYYVDFDGDTYGTGSGVSLCSNPGAGYSTLDGDCDDSNSAINPAATEICDGGVDNDCDGLVDDADPSITGQSTFYADNDADTYGAGAPILACVQPAGTSVNNLDCDDNNVAINPAAIEVCDGGVDNDCDGLADDADPSVTGQGTYYADNDGDTYGAGAAILACVQPAGTSVNNTDCNDNDVAINPAASEVCDGGVDNDCDGLVDDADPSVSGQLTWYADADGDTYGNAAVDSTSCNQPSGYVLDNSDCDDSNVAVNTGAQEICNGIDDDCDGDVDDQDASLIGLPTWYADADADGFGDLNASQTSCQQPSGYVSNSTDCDDATATTYPGATELCNGVDDDCDGVADDSLTFINYYVDFDGDTYGTGAAISLCSDPGAGYAIQDGDCDDSNAAINPAATEICDGIDNDCDGSIDNGLTFVTYYVDADGDTYGTGSGTSLCSDPGAGYATQDGDCDDTNAAINPAASEICDGIDNDCDGSIDNGLTFVTYYVDADGDTYGTGAGTSLCSDPGVGYATQDGDCDDTNAAINPAATEICDGIDNNCDGSIDNGLTFVTYYTDADGDTYGTGSGTSLCSDPGVGFATQAGDCDDTNAAINPAASEICDGIDNDCDGVADDSLTFVTYYVDADGDTYGVGAGTSLCSNPGAGYATQDGDCDDTNASINPAATEICDGIDNNCDGSIDNGLTFVTYYTDADGDTYGTGSGTSLCSDPGVGFATQAGDCDDTNAAINPAATEICDGIDNNCDGSIDNGLTFVTYYTDADGDTYGTGSGTSLCSDPGVGFATQAGDCDDTNAAINPAAQEICDGGVDNDCDGLADDADPSVNGQGTYYADNDGDTYGAGSAILSCVQPANTSTNSLDCDDNNVAINPAATEVCDGGVDNDCDGLADDADPSVTGQGTYYADNDGDTYGAGSAILACVQPANTSTNSLDCDDNNVAINPAATEVCDGGVDNDCDGLADDADPSVTGQGTYYADNDGDTYGAGSAILACVQPANTSTNNTDCDDTNASINPGATEVCGNGTDDDCDGSIDEGCVTYTFYADADGDSYGNAAVTTTSLNPTPPSGYVAVAGDCDDNNAAINPGAAEICNGIDDNCDGLIDNGTIGSIGSITGPASQCIPIGAGTAVFSVASQPSIISYTWTVPSGLTLVSGQGTNSITVSWTSTAMNLGINGPMTVTASTACETGSVISQNISINYTAPVRPGSISGPTRLCPGDVAVFSTSLVARANTYNWTIPTGLVVTSGNGTNAITVSVQPGYTGGTIAVTVTNSCGTSPDRTKTVGLNIPMTPDVISGQANGLCGSTGVVFTTAGTVTATSYLWTVPAGVTLVSGQGTNTITVNTVSGFVSGNITVSGVNACGTGTSRSLTITGYPAAAGPISGPINICPGATGVGYSVSTVAGASSYTWTLPTGVSLVNGAGTKQITVNYPSVTASGVSISVRTSNACGNSAVRTLGGISINSTFCAPRTAVAGETQNLSGLVVYPNPATDLVNLAFEAVKEGDYNLALTDLTGRTFIAIDGYAAMGLNTKTLETDGLTAGTYIVRLTMNDESHTFKVVIQN